MTQDEAADVRDVPEDEKPACFVISPIGPEGSAERKDADTIIRQVIAPAALQAGYQAPLRADMMPAPGMITEQIVERLLNADAVVADLTGHNPNVFYELAMRHAFKRPAVLLFNPDEPIPFDVHDLRAIPVTVHVDYATAAREQLAQALRFIREHPKESAVSPFARGLDYAAALNNARRDAGDPIAQLLALVMEMKQELTPRPALRIVPPGGRLRPSVVPRLRITMDETTDEVADRRRVSRLIAILSERPGVLPVELVFRPTHTSFAAPPIEKDELPSLVPRLRALLGVLGEVEFMEEEPLPF